MTDNTSVQKTNDELFEELKSKSKELKKKHEEMTQQMKVLNETLDKVLEKKQENHP